MLRSAHHGFYEIAAVEIDLKWQLGEIALPDRSIVLTYESRIRKVKNMLTRIIFVAAVVAVGAPAHAQTNQRLGNTIIGSDGSMAQPFGNGLLITEPPVQPPAVFGALPAPPRQVFCQRLANTVVCNESR
jgi:hypothetical protein